MTKFFQYLFAIATVVPLVVGIALYLNIDQTCFLFDRLVIGYPEITICGLISICSLLLLIYVNYKSYTKKCESLFLDSEKLAIALRVVTKEMNESVARYKQIEILCDKIDAKNKSQEKEIIKLINHLPGSHNHMNSYETTGTITFSNSDKPYSELQAEHNMVVMEKNTMFNDILNMNKTINELTEELAIKQIVINAFKKVEGKSSSAVKSKIKNHKQSLKKIKPVKVGMR